MGGRGADDEDASANAAADAALLQLLFRFKWCWRPEEMLEPRNTSVPGQPVDVCVWGVEHIVGPPSCTRQREPATCGTAR